MLQPPLPLPMLHRADSPMGLLQRCMCPALVWHRADGAAAAAAPLLPAWVMLPPLLPALMALPRRLPMEMGLRLVTHWLQRRWNSTGAAGAAAGDGTGAAAWSSGKPG